MFRASNKERRSPDRRVLSEGLIHLRQRLWPGFEPDEEEAEQDAHPPSHAGSMTSESDIRSFLRHSSSGFRHSLSIRVIRGSLLSLIRVYPDLHRFSGGESVRQLPDQCVEESPGL